MMLAMITVCIMMLGNLVMGLGNYMYRRKLLKELSSLRREKFSREIEDEKKKIRDHTASLSLDELVERENNR